MGKDERIARETLRKAEEQRAVKAAEHRQSIQRMIDGERPAT